MFFYKLYLSLRVTKFTNLLSNLYTIFNTGVCVNSNQINQKVTNYSLKSL